MVDRRKSNRTHKPEGEAIRAAAPDDHHRELWYGFWVRGTGVHGVNSLVQCTVPANDQDQVDRGFLGVQELAPEENTSMPCTLGLCYPVLNPTRFQHREHYAMHNPVRWNKGDSSVSTGG